jgi:hypothetical protein
MRAARALALAVLAGCGLLGAGAPDELAGFEHTPPRLAWVQGEALFLRGGEEGWGPAPVNLPLAPGDRLRTGENGALEIQLGPRDFLRASARTELALERHDPEFLELRVGAGLVSLDLRSLSRGHTVELATPHADVAIETNGGYRLEVAADATWLAARRGGRAVIAQPAGATLALAAGEQLVIGGGRVERFAAPEPDDWERWSDGRTDAQLGALSSRWAGDVYGARDLDQHGSWQRVAPYGAIWIPRVRPGWAPYGVGRWLWDPTFGWTWLDDAPWGWAPFHHGRWIFVRGSWAWVPGPLGPRLVYAPALVAFYGSSRTTVLWVPLGWGEPVRPWWGPRRWIGQPHWLGWGGPRIAAQTHVNAALRGGAIAVPGSAFGRSTVERARIAAATPAGLRLVRGALPVERPVLSTRVPQPRLRGGPEPRVVLPRGLAPRYEPPRYEPMRRGTRARPLAPGTIGIPAGERPGGVLPAQPAPRGGLRGGGRR